jgi:hypothetical protein
MTERPCVGLDPDTSPCPICGKFIHEPCPYEDLDPTLLVTKPVGVAGGPACDDDVCEACQ